MSATSQKIYDSLLGGYHVRRDVVTNGGVSEAIQVVRIDRGTGSTEVSGGVPSVATRTQVNDTNTDTLLLAANLNRLGAIVVNDSSATLYLGLGATTVTSTNYTTKILPNGYFEIPFSFTGQIRGIWATDPNDGGARITELTT